MQIIVLIMAMLGAIAGLLRWGGSGFFLGLILSIIAGLVTVWWIEHIRSEHPTIASLVSYSLIMIFVDAAIGYALLA